MKLLFLTQKVDKNDDVLGFVCRWLLSFSRKFEKITVICLEKGEYDLPQNVRVLSLGKEKGRSRLKYLINFYGFLASEGGKYDCVFVHMNQEYVILGGLIWRLLGKKIIFWYNHRRGNFFTFVSAKISNVVFYTSPFAFTARFKNAQIAPAGIDTQIFKKKEDIFKISRSVLCLGRISPVKKMEVLIEAAEVLEKNGIGFILNIAGESPQRDWEYFQKIKNLSRNLEEKGRIKFLGKISNLEAPDIYNRNEIFVNLTPEGSLDKTILEAMACEMPVIVANKSFGKDLPGLIFENSRDLSKKISALLDMPSGEKQALGRQLRDYSLQNHSLEKLTEKIISQL